MKKLNLKATYYNVMVRSTPGRGRGDPYTGKRSKVVMHVPFHPAPSPFSRWPPTKVREKTSETISDSAEWNLRSVYVWCVHFHSRSKSNLLLYRVFTSSFAHLKLNYITHLTSELDYFTLQENVCNLILLFFSQRYVTWTLVFSKTRTMCLYAFHGWK